MKYSELQRTHAEYDADVLQRNHDLHAGADALAKRIDRYISRHDVEPAELYARRLRNFVYKNYSAPIAGIFAAHVFSDPPVLGLVGGGDPPPYYAEFMKDVDGAKTDLDGFMALVFIEALVTKRAYVHVMFPEQAEPAATTVAEWERLGLGSARLRLIPTAAITNWGPRDDVGRPLWLVEHTRAEELIEFDNEQPTVTETWTLYHSEPGRSRRWRLAAPKNKPARPDVIVPEVEPPTDENMPIKELCLPAHLFLYGHLASPQMASLRAESAHHWHLQRCANATLMINVANKSKPPVPVTGSGYYVMLGVNEKMSYVAPGPEVSAMLASHAKDIKDEIHRLGNDMARGVDNNAAAIGRSGESKQADAATTDKASRAYGAILRTYIEDVMDQVALGRRFLPAEAEVKFHVSGMKDFAALDGSEIQRASTVLSTGIPSILARQEAHRRIIDAAWPDLDPELRQQIYKEIETAPAELEPENETGAKGGAKEPGETE